MSTGADGENTADGQNDATPATAAASPPRVTAVLMAEGISDADMPTVSLGPTFVATSDENTSTNHLETTTADATTVEATANVSVEGTDVSASIPVTTAAELVDVETGSGGTGVQDRMSYRIPAFVSTTIIKQPDQDESLGVRFRPGLESGDILIDSIESDSPLINTPLKPGFKVVSINGKNAIDLDAATASALLQTVVGTLTIVAHNPSGNAQIVSTMVEKPNPDSAVGLGVRPTGRGGLEVTKVKSAGLFAHSLLNVGDRLLSINEMSCAHLDARAAMDIIQNAPKYVTLATETQSSVGVVLAAAAERSQSNVALATASTLSFDLNNEMSAYSHNFCYCMWMLIVSLLIIGIVVTMKKG